MRWLFLSSGVAGISDFESEGCCVDVQGLRRQSTRRLAPPIPKDNIRSLLYLPIFVII